MPIPRTLRTAVALSALMLLASCGSSPDSRYYLLTASTGTPAAGSQPVPGGGVIIVDEASVAPYVDRTQMVRREGAFRIGFDEFDVWAEPISGLITARMVDELGARYGLDTVLTASSARGVRAGFRVGLDVLRLDIDEANRVVMDARWLVFAERRDCPVLTRRLIGTRTLPAEAPVDARVTAFSELLADLAAQIAGGIDAFGRGGCAP